MSQKQKIKNKPNKKSNYNPPVEKYKWTLEKIIIVIIVVLALIIMILWGVPVHDYYPGMPKF